MNKIIFYNKIKYFFSNPTLLLGLILFCLSLLLVLTTHFNIPCFFTDKELANQIAQTVPISAISTATKHLFNPKYDIENSMFQIWAWLFAALLFCVIFRINKYDNLKNIKIFSNKYFLYLWVNLSYPIFSFCYLCTYMSDLEKYVYNSAADTFAIPMLGMLVTIFMFSVIYYPLINLIIFVTYNTKIKRLLYKIIWLILIFILLILVIICFIYHFNYLIICMDFIILIWFMIAINSIKYLNNK